MIHHTRDLLAVSFEDGHHLFGVPVEDRSVLIRPACDELGCVFLVHVHTQDAGHGGRVQTWNKIKNSLIILIKKIKTDYLIN